MCPMGGGCQMLVHRFSANQCLPVLETYHIPFEHTVRTMLIQVRVISIEESVPETFLFGLPSFKLKLPMCLRSLSSAPFNARCDGIGRICHGSPPFLDRTSADCVAHRPPSPAKLEVTRVVTKFLHVVLPGGLAVRSLARRAGVACPIRKTTPLLLGVMISGRLVLGKASCHSSATRSVEAQIGCQGIKTSYPRFLFSC
jgi:hypothetical protein